MTTLMTSTVKSPLKCLYNEWRCLGHLQHPDEAANEILDFVKALAPHGVCYASTAKKPMKCNCLASLSSQLEEGSSFTDQVVVELYDKFHMLIPVEYHNDWFYFTTTPLMETCAKVKAN